MEPYAKAQAWNRRWWEETLTRVRVRITNRDPSCAAPCCNLASHQPCLRSLDPDEWVRRQEVLAGGRKKGRVQIESPRRRRRPMPPPTPAPPESPWRNRRGRDRTKRGSERSRRNEWRIRKESGRRLTGGVRGRRLPGGRARVGDAGWTGRGCGVRASVVLFWV
jgi:hypothetical protein